MRTFRQSKQHRSKSLLRDQRGSTLPIMGAAFLLVLAGVGSAIDLGRIYVVRSQMQAGVDAASLAGARSFEAKGTGPESRDKQVLAYFRENFPIDYLGAGTVVPVPTFSVVKGINVTKVDANVSLPMVFMGMFGIEPRPIEVTATAELQPRPLEVMVVLDDTGSMQTKLPDGRTRMAVLQDAMHGFVNVLYQGSTSREELALGMITYTVSTNVGGILKAAGVPIQKVDGYTNLDSYLGGKSGIGEQGLAWKGCVDDDPTVQDLSADAATSEAGAADVSRAIPAGGVRPYMYSQSAETKNRATSKTDGAYSTTSKLPADYQPSDLQSATSDSRRNNLYTLTSDAAIAQGLANSQAYKANLYNFYIGLNYNRTSDADDVIVTKTGGWYNPALGPVDANYTVMYSRIPYITDATAWGPANANYGYPLPAGTSANLKMPSPNWQCPSPGMEVKYGRSKTDYESFIDNQNYPLMPASGTLHHIGMLWGYRLLARDDLFKRTNPKPDQEPLRALVFMTDGQTQAGSYATWSGAYGRLAERRLTTSVSENTFRDQVMYRFGKVCQNAKTEKNPIKVYIVSLLHPESTTEGIFRGCAGDNYLETTTSTQIMDAFRNIAVDLVQLHLTQ